MDKATLIEVLVDEMNPPIASLPLEHHEAIRRLTVMRNDAQRIADQLHEALDYSAEFPAAEAEALQYALDNLSLDGPLTFSARYFKGKYEALAEPTPGMVVRALLAAHPERGTYTDTEFNQMHAALKAGWGLPPG